MMWGGGTTVSYGFDDYCSTGCPTCGCTNPGHQMLIVISNSTSARSRYSEPALKILPMEAWLMEQRQTPRRMKRSFPASKPSTPPAYRRACY